MFPHELRIGAGLPIPATEVESTPASPARASEVVARTSDRIEAKGTGATSGALATNSAAQIREPLRRRSSAEFDFVVVGAGAAGATTAARLVEQGYRVLVLERGEEHANVLARDVPAGHAKASEDPRLLVDDTGYFVRFFDDQKRNESNPNYDHERGGFFYPRGEGIGGSTQQHAMIFVRAPDVDFDRIAELTGDASWSGKNMQQFWNVLEQNRYQPILRGLHWLGKVTNIEALQNLGGYGFDGWQKTTRADVKILLRDKQLLSLALRTLWFCMSHFDGETPVVRQLGDKVRNLIAKFDPNHSLSRGREGFRILPKMIDENGRRFGPRERLLSVLEEHPDRLTIRTGCTVDRVELDDSMRANHVEYLDENGERQQVLAGREVVLAAGSFETPMILMRSGIGPEEELKKLEKHGYESRLVRPGVGKALSDRYEYGVVSRLQEPSTIAAGASLDFGPNDRFFQEWKQGKGPYTTNGDFSALEIKTDPSLDAPNVMALDVIGRFTGYRVGYADEALKDPSLVTHLVLDAHRGDQRGFLTVNPDDPFKPDINFAYHEDDVLRANGLGDDRSVIAHQIENVARPIRDKARVVKEEVFPGDQVRGHDALKEAVGKGTWGHHPVRTCKMGKASDPDAVCDSRFNVIGTQGLRVIDASIFPGNMGTFLVSSVMLAAEKGADLLDREAKLADGDTQSPLAVSIQQRSK